MSSSSSDSDSYVGVQMAATRTSPVRKCKTDAANKKRAAANIGKKIAAKKRAAVSPVGGKPPLKRPSKKTKSVTAGTKKSQ